MRKSISSQINWYPCYSFILGSFKRMLLPLLVSQNRTTSLILSYFTRIPVSLLQPLMTLHLPTLRTTSSQLSLLRTESSHPPKNIPGSGNSDQNNPRTGTASGTTPDRGFGSGVRPIQLVLAMPEEATEITSVRERESCT